MCGIAGLVLRHTCGEAHLPEEAAAHVRAMLDSMAWRGPDGQGVSLDGPVCLGHRRLSIIDLSGGAQPMSNGRHTLTFNGEIYNYRELRATMEQEGFRFRTSSDTEVLLAAYERWDTDCLSRLDGMFAFALWDARRRRLFCARDRFGKKPFFYAQTRHFFIFASELHALARVPSLKLTLSPEALPRFMPYDYVPTPDTPYVEARSLPPAHWLLLQEGMPHIERYWDLPMPDETDERSEEDLCEELRALMFNAVRRRMISDVPLGVFLSGGIDSSIVAGCMALHANQPVKTFSIGFREASKNALCRNPNYRPTKPEGMGDWMHINSMSCLGPNKWYDAGDERFHPENLIVDGREANIIFIIEKKTGKVVWKLGPDYDNSPEARAIGWIIGQHHAHMIPKTLPGGGNILVFDNGGWGGYDNPNPGSPTGVKAALRDYSRVLEIDPVSMKIVWQYTPREAGFLEPMDSSRFYSPFISGMQRLPNGNTLITEGSNGRVFEVTPDHKIVWEFISPYWGKHVPMNMTYRAYRVPYEWVPQVEKPVETPIKPLDVTTFRVPGAAAFGDRAKEVSVEGCEPYGGSNALCVASVEDN